MTSLLAQLFQRHAKLIGFSALFLIAILASEGVMDPRRLVFDFANFYDAGQKALIGETSNLYNEHALINGEEPFGHMLYFGTPISAYFFAPLALFQPQHAAILFKLSNVLCVIGGLVLLYRKYVGVVSDNGVQKAVFFGLFCVAALLFQPFWTVLHVGGQTTPWLFLMLTIGLIAYENEKYGLVALLYTLSVLIKPALIPGAGLLFLFAPRRFKYWSLGLGSISALISVLTLGWPIHMEFLELLRQHSGELMVIPYHNAHFLGWIEPLFYGPADYAELDSRNQPIIMAGLNAVLRLFVMAFILGFIWRFANSDIAPRARNSVVFVGTLMAALVYSPVVWPHYLALVFVIVVHVLAFRRFFPDRAMVVLGLIVLSALAQHIWTVSKIVEQLAPLNQMDVFLATALRGVTMTLFLVLIFAYRASFAASLRADEWTRVKTPVA